MSKAKNEPGTQDQVLTFGDAEVAVLTEKVIEKAKAQEAQAASIRDRDPFEVYKRLPKGFKASDEGRNYQGMIDLSRSIRDWLDNGGSFYSSKAGVQVSMSIEDAAHSKDFSMLFPTVIQSAIIEHLEPQSNIMSLYQKIRNPSGAVLKFPIWGPAGSGINLYVGETGEPNTLTSQFSGHVTATTEKYGIRTSVTDEVKENSVIDLYRLQIMWAGEAVQRFEERIATQNLFDAAEANVLFDNAASPTDTILGHTSGRDYNGLKNGTLGQYDWFEALAHANANGSDPKIIIMHPLMWRAIMNNSIMRDLRANAGQPVWQINKQGLSEMRTPGGLSAVFSKEANRATGAGTSAGIATNAQFSGSVTGPGGQDFAVYTTPYANVQKADNVNALDDTGSVTTTVQNRYVGDIVFADPRDIGFFVVEKELYVREETRLFDQFIDTAMFKKAGFATANKSRGLFKLKNIVASEGYDLESTPVVRQMATALPASDADGPAISLT